MSVEVGQVYREKDKRFTRYVRVDSFAVKHGLSSAWCAPCTISGLPLRAGRTTRLKLSNLEKRFELIEQEKE